MAAAAAAMAVAPGVAGVRQGPSSIEPRVKQLWIDGSIESTHSGSIYHPA